MQSLTDFVVEIENKLQDTIKTESGLELFIETKFNEFERRTTEGVVVSAPLKHETGAKAGDTVYFHHHVVIHGGSPLVEEDNHYLVNYDDNHAASSQAIAYKSKKDNIIRPLKGWSLLEPVEEDIERPSEIIEVVDLKEKVVTQGVVSFPTPELELIGVSKGDVVGFKKNRDYRIRIDDKEYYRVAISELLYKVQHP